MGPKTHPRKINASSTAIPSWLLATSSIFCRALSISGNLSVFQIEAGESGDTLLPRLVRICVDV
jgi:hypothetical protein